MSDQSGTPNPAPETVSPAVNQESAGKDGSEQKWQEALKWKEKAEAYNKLENEKRQMEQRLAELERVAYSGGVQAATDPTAELVNQLREAAAYDPASRAALLAMQESATARAEQWLLGELLSVPESKRAKVAAIVRQSNYQVGIKDAIDTVTDPETASYQQKLLELQAENERLKSRSQVGNGSSPMSAYPAADAGGPSKETVPWSEMSSTLRRGGEAARALRAKWDSGEIKPDYTK